MSHDLKIRGYTVGQRPNAPLLVAIIALLAAIFIPSGWVEDVARAVFYVGLTVWGYEELANGVNGFRRGLGALALVLVVVGLARSFA